VVSLPVVSGTAKQGQTLATSAGSWDGTTPMTYAYQWQRCNSAGGMCSAISGATSSSYVPATADVGSTLRASVAASNSAGTANASSSPTAVVVAPPSTSPPGCGTGAYECWLGTQLACGAGNVWRTCAPNPINSAYSYNVPGSTPVGSQYARLKIDANGPYFTSAGVKNSLNTWHDDDGTGSPSPHTGRGEETWYRVIFRWPQNAFTSGDWNFVEQWHNETSELGGRNTFMGVRCDAHTPGLNCRLFFNLRSGVGAADHAYDPFATGSIQLNHWYDSVFRIKWEPDNTGSFTWYLDGVKVTDVSSVPTLAVTSTGVIERPDFDILNYRRNDISSTSYEDFALAAWGPTADSVGFTVP
jgi:hypothetical protein